MSAYKPDPSLIELRAAAKIIGCCPRLLANDYVRAGLIAGPDAWGRFKKQDVENLAAEFERRRKAAKDDDD